MSNDPLALISTRKTPQDEQADPRQRNVGSADLVSGGVGSTGAGHRGDGIAVRDRRVHQQGRRLAEVRADRLAISPRQRLDNAIRVVSDLPFGGTDCSLPMQHAERKFVVGMTATRFTIAEPSDPGMLDVAGFDTAVPNVMSDFAHGI